MKPHVGASAHVQEDPTEEKSTASLRADKDSSSIVGMTFHFRTMLGESRKYTVLDMDHSSRKHIIFELQFHHTSSPLLVKQEDFDLIWASIEVIKKGDDSDDFDDLDEPYASNESC
jgi:hypothetical protein